MTHFAPRVASALKIGFLTLPLLLAGCGSFAPPAPTASAAADAEGSVSTLAINGVSASSSNSGYPASNATDGKLSTWWSADGVGAWIRFDLGSVQNVDAVTLAWYRGGVRKATFDVEVSRDGSSWTRILSRATSSGSTTNPERYNVPDTDARFVRIVNQGNTENSAIAIAEAQVNLNGEAPAPTSGSGSGRTFYVDCGGSDGNSGTSAQSAWRSIGKANNASLQPGDNLLFKRGCTWTGPLNARWYGTSSAPITIGAYGSGDQPQIRNGSPGAVTIRGKYQIIDNLRVSADKPASKDTGRCYGPLGWRVGFSLASGASNNTLRNSSASGLTAGVHIEEGATYNKVLNNNLTNNTVMSTNTSGTYDEDSGAWGMLVNGDHNEVAYNYLSGNTACSEDYGVEGASFEVYKASYNYFHHNRSINDTTFTELGGVSGDFSTNNTYAYNLYAPLNTNGRGELLVVRGWKSKWGANPGTKFYNNTAFNTNLGIFCGDGCSASILSARNNVIVTRSGATKDTLWSDAPFDEGNNVYYQLDGQRKVTIQNGGISSSSRVANPQLADPWGQNFTLGSSSPALGIATLSALLNLDIKTDLAGKPTPVGGLDAGAFERQ